MTLCVLVCFVLLLGLRDPKRVEYGVSRGESIASCMSVRCYGGAVQIETTEGPQLTCWPPYKNTFFFYYLLCSEKIYEVRTEPSNVNNINSAKQKSSSQLHL